MKTWELEDARTRFGEVTRRALAHPQRVVLGDREAVVVVSAADYATLTFARDLVEFIRRSASSSGHEAEWDRRRPHDAAGEASGNLEGG